MDVLFLAPQPLKQDRGTSIANAMVLEGFSRRGVRVDVVTYAEGQPLELDHVKLHRVPDLPFLRGIRPGFSLKKIIADWLMLFVALWLVFRNDYDYIYAVEEAVFLALFLRFLLRIPYVYDMDSSLAEQMTAQFKALRFARPLMRLWEGIAIRHADMVVPVCDALGDLAQRYKPRRLVHLRDVPLLTDDQPEVAEDLRSDLGITGSILMYVGNLESYQGIDLLLESFKLVLRSGVAADLIVIGGTQAAVARYQAHCATENIADRVHFLGPRPLAHLSYYLDQADILVSPRLLGINTPMKIYSYLSSGKPIVATDICTHTQVLDEKVAVLAAPEPKAYAEGLLRLLHYPRLGTRLGAAGVQLSAEKYNDIVYASSLNQIIDWLEAQVTGLPNIVMENGSA